MLHKNIKLYDILEKLYPPTRTTFEGEPVLFDLPIGSFIDEAAIQELLVYENRDVLQNYDKEPASINLLRIFMKLKPETQRILYNRFLSYQCYEGDITYFKKLDNYNFEVIMTNDGYNFHCPSSDMSVPGMPKIDLYDNDEVIFQFDPIDYFIQLTHKINTTTQVEVYDSLYFDKKTFYLDPNKTDQIEIVQKTEKDEAGTKISKIFDGKKANDFFVPDEEKPIYLFGQPFVAKYGLRIEYTNI